jgi:hypothetical protein
MMQDRNGQDSDYLVPSTGAGPTPRTEDRA